MDKKYNIHIHSKRKRLSDEDGTSHKAAIDGLIEGGLFPDDSSKYVKKVSQSQEKVNTHEEEQTIIEIYS